MRDCYLSGAIVTLLWCGICFPDPVRRKYLALFNQTQAGRLQTRDRAGLESTAAQVYRAVTDPRVGPAISWTRFYPHFELCLRRPQTRELVLVTSETSV